MDVAQLPYAWLPAEGSRARNYRALWLIERAKRARTIERYPRLDDLDEYPLVPLLIEDDRRVLYDSSALVQWIDECHPSAAGPLIPPDPALAFVARLIDEAFDEIGLYLVHHNRWVMSATTNDAGARLAREFARVRPPGAGWLMARRFSERQVRRLPYLFSVAPAGFAAGAGLRRALTPPSRPGFPPTHALLDGMWREYLAAVDAILVRQPFLLGERFTLADAGVYGQLAMNLADPSAADAMRRHAPTTFAWLEAIRDRRHVAAPASASAEAATPAPAPLGLLTRDALASHAALSALLALVARTFIPLMQQNARAHAAAYAAGERVFNERAFDRGRALYEGTLLGHPFRAVAKTFQVRVWTELRDAWRRLPADARAALPPVVGAAMDTGDAGSTGG